MNLLEEQSNVVKFMHLSIDYDKENQSIIYGRKLLDGPGSTYYGIEIADFIICDPEFILNAKEVRCKILNTSSIILDEKKTSNYNSKLYVDKCSICGVTGSSYPLDTHHIKEQHTFDETIHHDFHKNKLANLVVLCKEHHDAVHHGNLEIVGYKECSNGIDLEYKIIENISCKKNSRLKYSIEEITVIKALAEECDGQKQFMKVLLCELKKKNMNISSHTVQKILNDTYL